MVEKDKDYATTIKPRRIDYKFTITYVGSRYEYATHTTGWHAAESYQDAFETAMRQAFEMFGGNVRGIVLADTF